MFSVTKRVKLICGREYFFVATEIKDKNHS